MGSEPLEPHRHAIHGAHDASWFAFTLLVALVVLMVAAGVALAPGPG